MFVALDNQLCFLPSGCVRINFSLVYPLTTDRLLYCPISRRHMNGITFRHDIKGMIIDQRLPFLAHGFLPMSCLRTSKRSFVGERFTLVLALDGFVF